MHRPFPDFAFPHCFLEKSDPGAGTRGIGRTTAACPAAACTTGRAGRIWPIRPQGSGTDLVTCRISSKPGRCRSDTRGRWHNPTAPPKTCSAPSSRRTCNSRERCTPGRPARRRAAPLLLFKVGARLRRATFAAVADVACSAEPLVAAPRPLVRFEVVACLRRIALRAQLRGLSHAQNVGNGLVVVFIGKRTIFFVRDPYLGHEAVANQAPCKVIKPPNIACPLDYMYDPVEVVERFGNERRVLLEHCRGERAHAARAVAHVNCNRELGRLRP